MNSWPKYPAIYEINTWVWLHELIGRYRKQVTIGTVPDKEWDAIASYGFDAVWLMGVWERSPAGIAISMKNDGLLTDFRRALPDFRPEDNVGSPYCVRRYVVDEQPGGPKDWHGPKDIARPWHEADVGFRSQSRRAGSSLGDGASRILHSGQRGGSGAKAGGLHPCRR